MRSDSILSEYFLEFPGCSGNNLLQLFKGCDIFRQVQQTNSAGWCVAE